MSLRFHHHEFPNRLAVIAETDSDAHTAAVGFFVKTGARDEQQQIMGVSHFLEHMMFKGTARRSADDVNREFDEIGASYNAYTDHENTVYWAHLLPEFLSRAVDLVGDMLRPALRREDFDMEKSVILEEIGMYEDRPPWRLQDKITETHFNDHPLGFRVLGTADSIKALAVDQMCEYFEQRYGPDNIVVAAAGHLDFDSFLEETGRIAGHWKPTNATRVYDEPVLKDVQQSMTDDKLNRHYAAMLCGGPSAQDERRYAAAVLSDVLGDADGSRLYWALVDPGLADEADFSYMAQDGVGSFLAFVSCDPSRAEAVEKGMLDTIDGCATNIESDEIERAKNKIATDATLHGESPAGRMRDLGQQWTYRGTYVPLAEQIERMMAVTADDVHDLITEVPFRPRTVVRLGPRNRVGTTKSKVESLDS